ncbi:hypothetical protein ACO3VM_09235 [Methanocaldococcus sp. 10A]
MEFKKFFVITDDGDEKENEIDRHNKIKIIYFRNYSCVQKYLN